MEGFVWAGARPDRNEPKSGVCLFITTPVFVCVCPCVWWGGVGGGTLNNPPLVRSRSNEQSLISCQGVIPTRAAILDESQEGAVKVSCCFLLLPENYRLFWLHGAAQQVLSQSQAED